MRLRSVTTVAILVIAAACSPTPSQAPGPSDSPTPPPVAGPSFVIVCEVPATPTPAEAEGPFFKTGSPENTIFFGPEDREGETLVLGGAVVDTSCQPIGGATVDIWQADPFGDYDEVGFAFRGHAVTRPDGTFRFDTLIPGSYEGEPPQIHAKVTGAGRQPLTTQLYLPPGTGANPALVPAVEVLEEATVASFTFVLAGG